MQRLTIAEADERAMAQWRRDHPKDVLVEREFWMEQKAARKWAREEKKKWKAFSKVQHAHPGPSNLDPNDDRLFNFLLNTEEEEDIDSDSNLSDYK
ncbi:hypothetical protein ACQ4PT_014265 [Festuca glaucescens]